MIVKAVMNRWYIAGFVFLLPVALRAQGSFEAEIRRSFDSVIDSVLSQNGVRTEDVEFVFPSTFAGLVGEQKLRSHVLAFESLESVINLRKLDDDRLERVISWTGRGRLIRSDRRDVIEFSTRTVRDTINQPDETFYPAYVTVIRNGVESMWDTTLAPILVSLGAIAIIALFFFVRS